ncbi:unnamed protein product [Linum trigynum]|uniref:Uncharacterized protein n=1 Tax=Linum trigynum TaxID=586398 RepID=A0AAV2E2Q6_9ROSI
MGRVRAGRVDERYPCPPRQQGGSDLPQNRPNRSSKSGQVEIVIPTSQAYYSNEPADMGDEVLPMATTESYDEELEAMMTFLNTLRSLSLGGFSIGVTTII